MDKLKVLIGIPSEGKSSDAHHRLFLMAFDTAVKEGKRLGYEPKWVHCNAPGIDRARNELGVMTLNKKYDALLMLDNDVLMWPDAIAKLMRHIPELDIVSGLYPRRDSPHEPIIGKAKTIEMHGKKVLGFAYPYGMNPPINKVVECDWVGAGCLLITRKALETIIPPWFLVTKFGGEDIYFCLKAKKYGFKVYVDTSIECAHIVEHWAGRPEFINKLKELLGITRFWHGEQIIFYGDRPELEQEVRELVMKEDEKK